MNSTEWVNKMSMTSLAGLIGQVVWLIGSLVLTVVCARLLLTGPGDYFGKAPLASDPAKLADTMALYLAMGDSYIKACQQSGLILSAALFGAWGYAKTINTVQHAKDRTTSREYVSAIEDGKVAGTARALALATAAQDLESQRTTKERAAVLVTGDQPTVEVGTADVEPEPRPDPKEWADGDPRAGVL